MHARNARETADAKRTTGLRLSRFGFEADAAGDLGQGLVRISLFSSSVSCRSCAISEWVCGVAMQDYPPESVKLTLI